MKTATPPLVVVMDMNHHVRDFLKRELEKEGFVVSTASNGRELSFRLDQQPSPQVVVIDPEAFQPGVATRIENIILQYPGVQLIFHTYSDCFDEYTHSANLHFVEKSASSIAPLKEEIRRIVGLTTED